MRCDLAPGAVCRAGSPACAVGQGGRHRIARRVTTATPMVIGMSTWDMHWVAMTRKPVQCLALRLSRHSGHRCATPKDPAPQTRGDAVAADYLAWRGDPPSWPDGRPSSSEPKAVVGCGMLCGARHFHLQHRPLGQGCMRWGMHGQCDVCVDRELPAGDDHRQAIRPGADVEFEPIWAELFLSRLKTEREHRRQANPYAARVKCSVSRPVCPLPY